MIMKCKEVQKQLVNYYYRELPAEEVAAVAEHLRSCAACQQAWEELQQTLQKIEGKDIWPQKQPEFWDNFALQVRQKIAGKKPAVSHWQGWLRPTRLVPVLAGAVFLLLVAVNGIKMVEQRQQEKKQETQIINDLDVVENLELLQDLELMENLKEIEELKG